MSTPRDRRGLPAGRRRAAHAAAAVCLAMLWAMVGAGEVWAQRVEPGWTFESDELTELWFHGLAVVGFDGFGAEPLYDRGYAVDARAGFGERVQETDLAVRRRELRAAFEADPAFEVLHFVPLYFRGATREDANSQFHLGEAYRQGGQVERAAGQYERTLGLDPAHPQAAARSIPLIPTIPIL